MSQVYDFAADTNAYPWLGPVFWYNFQDFAPYGSTTCSVTSECFYGILRYDGSAKPAYTNYRAVPN